jgi:hypothetical protein
MTAPGIAIANMSERNRSSRAIPTIIANNTTRLIAGTRITTLYRRPSAIPARKADQPQTRCMVSSRVRADQLVGALARACAKKLRKRIPWCMIRHDLGTRRSLGRLSESSPADCRVPDTGDDIHRNLARSPINQRSAVPIRCAPVASGCWLDCEPSSWPYCSFASLTLQVCLL